MSTIFSKIIAGEIPCHKVAENSEFLAFLDIQPIRMGHVLVIPKKETDYFFDLEDSELGELMVFSKKVAAAIKTVFPCKKSRCNGHRIGTAACTCSFITDESITRYGFYQGENETIT